MYNNKPKKFAAKVVKKSGFRPRFERVDAGVAGEHETVMFGKRPAAKAKFSAKSGGKSFKKFAK